MSYIFGDIIAAAIKEAWSKGERFGVVVVAASVTGMYLDLCNSLFNLFN